MSFRLFPIVIIACITFIALKAADISDRRQTLAQAIFGMPLRAEETGDDTPENKEKDAAAETKEKKDEDEQKSEESVQKDQADKEQEKTDESKAEVKQEPQSSVPEPTQEAAFSPSELDILQRLSQRREELDRRQHDIEIKESVLHLTQKKIDASIANLRVLKTDVEKMLTQYNEKEDAKIKSLVKIYENMKPKDAAEILEDLEMETLLQVISKMSERKVAPILAQMSPDRAKELTLKFANRQKLNAPSAEKTAAR